MSERDVDQLLVEKVQAGDLRAFDLLVNKYQHKVIALAQKFVDPEEAKDISQDAFVKAYKALPRFRGDSAFYTWLYRIAINTAKNHLQSRARRPKQVNADITELEPLGLGDALKGPDSSLGEVEKDELESIITKTLQKLPEDLRTAVTLREFDGLSYEDIAEVMQCPIGTVRSRIFRAREAIEIAIKNIGSQDEKRRNRQSNKR